MQPDKLPSERLIQLVSLQSDPLPQKTYTAGRNEDQELNVTVAGEPLDPRFDLRNHSPTGFECGYSGSGAAQLALAILADHFGNDASALNLYQDFKWKVVAGLPKTGWTLTTVQIDEALRGLDQDSPQPES